MERQEGRKEGREGTEKGEWKGAVPTKPPPSSDTSPGRGKEGKWRRRIGGRGEREGKNGRAGREGRKGREGEGGLHYAMCQGGEGTQDRVGKNERKNNNCFTREIGEENQTVQTHPT